MYKCLIIDDERLARRLIENYLATIEGFEVLASCRSAIEASRIIGYQAVDLLFLDIEMPVLTGTEFYKNLTSKPRVIFTTAYRDYAVEGFEMNAVDYLVKPIEFDRFFKSIEKFLELIGDKQFPIEDSLLSYKSYIFVSEGRKQVKIRLDDILYIESSKNYVKINTHIKTHSIKNGISSFESLLDSRFIRVHRSYIVNSDKISACTKQDIEIDDIEIPIGESYRLMVEKALSN